MQPFSCCVKVHHLIRSYFIYYVLLASSTCYTGMFFHIREHQCQWSKNSAKGHDPAQKRLLIKKSQEQTNIRSLFYDPINSYLVWTSHSFHWVCSSKAMATMMAFLWQEATLYWHHSNQIYLAKKIRLSGSSCIKHLFENIDLNWLVNNVYSIA